jgi:murein DD-endopeptidase MepM/ murein hydrolase activator NlpD
MNNSGLNEKNTGFPSRWKHMTQLIVQQRIRKRRKAAPAQKTPEAPITATGPWITKESRLNGFLGNLPKLKVPKLDIAAKLKLLGTPKFLYISGIAAALIVVLFFSSSVISHGMTGKQINVSVLPRDGGIDSLLDSYLSPGSFPDSLGDQIQFNGPVLISYEPTTYLVPYGDTVSAIAIRFGLSQSTIISFNGIDDVYHVPVGEELKIPPVDGVLHQVKKNESLSSIAALYGVDLAPILDSNNIASENIAVGQKLFVPSGEMSDTAFRSAMGTLWAWPLPISGIVSSRYGPRTDPFTGLKSVHRGIDIVAASGTRVLAANKGQVIDIGETSLYGKYVILKHRDGFQTLYAHLSKWSVTEGRQVSQGNKIGEVGNTGRSTGAHLHFSIFQNGRDRDPDYYL